MFGAGEVGRRPWGARRAARGVGRGAQGVGRRAWVAAYDRSVRRDLHHVHNLGDFLPQAALEPHLHRHRARGARAARTLQLELNDPTVDGPDRNVAAVGQQVRSHFVEHAVHVLHRQLQHTLDGHLLLLALSKWRGDGLSLSEVEEATAGRRRRMPVDRERRRRKVRRPHTY